MLSLEVLSHTCLLRRSKARMSCHAREAAYGTTRSIDRISFNVIKVRTILLAPLSACHGAFVARVPFIPVRIYPPQSLVLQENLHAASSAPHYPTEDQSQMFSSSVLFLEIPRLRLYRSLEGVVTWPLYHQHHPLALYIDYAVRLSATVTLEEFGWHVSPLTQNFRPFSSRR